MRPTSGWRAREAKPLMKDAASPLLGDGEDVGSDGMFPVACMESSKIVPQY